MSYRFTIAPGLAEHSTFVMSELQDGNGPGEEDIIGAGMIYEIHLCDFRPGPSTAGHD